MHHSRRAELNEALIGPEKVKWGSQSSPLRNVETYASRVRSWQSQLLQSGVYDRVILGAVKFERDILV